MKRITIIGGGASGTLLAINLIRKHLKEERIEINWIEKRKRFGQGVAFGTRHPVHLLNVPAAKIGAFPDDPEHFHRWLASEGYDFEPADFVPRLIYGKYLSATLDATISQASGNAVLNFYDDEAVDIRFDEVKAEVVLASGDTHYAEAVVLAFGNFLPPNPTVGDRAFTDSPKYFRDPWGSDVEKMIETDDDVLILGTGLSMADNVLRLRENGHTGSISAISTRGLLPAVHKLGFTYPAFSAELKGLDRITDILKIVRKHAALAMQKGSDWRAVVDSLRPVTQELWLGLPLAEQKHFMQHLSRYWNIARHRMPPQVHSALEEMRTAGNLVILQGRLVSITHSPEGFLTEYSHRGETRTLRSDAIINCIASQSNFGKVESQLVKNLLLSGAIRCDDLKQGIDADPDGTVKHAEGRPNKLLYTLGTALKGLLLESTAIPEIRIQATNLADRLLA